MIKKILTSLLVPLTVLISQQAYAVCASRIVFVQDDSPTVQHRINEANMIKRALDDAVGDNYIHLPFSQFYALSRGTYRHFRGPLRAGSFQHSLLFAPLAGAIDLCMRDCTEEDIHERGFKCAIVYWSDNVISHKNPNLASRDYAKFRGIMTDTWGNALNSTHRFVIDLSFVTQSTRVAPELRAMSEELHTFTQSASYRGIPLRDSPTATLSQERIQEIVAGILDRFGHSE